MGHGRQGCVRAQEGKRSCQRRDRISDSTQELSRQVQTHRYYSHPTLPAQPLLEISQKPSRWMWLFPPGNHPTTLGIFRAQVLLPSYLKALDISVSITRWCKRQAQQPAGLGWVSACPMPLHRRHPVCPFCPCAPPRTPMNPSHILYSPVHPHLFTNKSNIYPLHPIHSSAHHAHNAHLCTPCNPQITEYQVGSDNEDHLIEPSLAKAQSGEAGPLS